MKPFSYAITIIFFVSMALAKPVNAAGNDSNIFKAGVSYTWLPENDSQGFLFYNKYGRYLTDHIVLGFNLGALNASRYDNVMGIYTVKNKFFTATLVATVDIVNNK
ncbi:hypothetical protein [Pontibacter harenae]|uniref:hypothetical protein n=1 Tax=Pontibacter harenae TaxID=2894083 RepID=UPI001E3FC62D|nr:hypothetical protein [Pontibacter harenae]MCC9165689.1 hypothetical protein [Pontibacter harenae]